MESSKDIIPFWEGIVLKLNPASEGSCLCPRQWHVCVLYWQCLHDAHMARQELCPQGSGAWWNCRVWFHFSWNSFSSLPLQLFVLCQWLHRWPWLLKASHQKIMIKESLLHGLWTTCPENATIRIPLTCTPPFPVSRASHNFFTFLCAVSSRHWAVLLDFAISPAPQLSNWEGFPQSPLYSMFSFQLKSSSFWRRWH